MENLSNETNLNTGYEADISESSTLENHTNNKKKINNQGSETLSNDLTDYDADVSEISQTQSTVVIDETNTSNQTENTDNGCQISVTCWCIFTFLILVLMVLIVLGLFLYFGTERAIWTFQRTNSTLFWSLTLLLL